MAEWALGQLRVSLVEGWVGAIGVDLFLPEFGIDCIAVEGSSVGGGTVGEEHVSGGICVVVCREVMKVGLIAGQPAVVWAAAEAEGEFFVVAVVEECREFSVKELAVMYKGEA